MAFFPSQASASVNVVIAWQGRGSRALRPRIAVTGSLRWDGRQWKSESTHFVILECCAERPKRRRSITFKSRLRPECVHDELRGAPPHGGVALLFRDQRARHAR